MNIASELSTLSLGHSIRCVTLTLFLCGIQWQLHISSNLFAVIFI